MSELVSVFLTSSLTLVAGIALLVSGQIITRFFIDPAFELRATIAEVDDLLIYLSIMLYTPAAFQAHIADAADQIRKKASLLHSRSHSVPTFSYDLFRKLGLLPPLTNVDAAHRAMLKLCTSLPTSSFHENFPEVQTIKRLLGFPFDEISPPPTPAA